MKSIILSIIIFFTVAIYSNVPAQSAKTSFKLKDLQKLVNLSSPAISPDGSQIAIIVSKPDWEKDKSDQEIDLVNVADGSLRTITYKREKISKLSWSPDGGSLGFIASDSGSKETQIFIMPMNGGDPQCITDSKTGVTEYSWSPNGKNIAYVAQDTIPNPKEIKHHEDAFKVTDNDYMVRAAIQPWHLWIVSSKGGKARQLTKGTQSLCTDQETISPLEWSRDGSTISFQLFPNVWEGNAWHCTIAKVDTNGGNTQTVIQDEGASKPQYNPITNTLTFMRPRNGDQNNGNAVYADINNKISDITKELARNIDNYVWLPDGKSLLFTGEKGTRSVIWNQSLEGHPKILDLGNVNIEGDITVSKNGVIAFTGSTAYHPMELYVMTSLNANPKQLTNLNIFVDSLSLSKTENISWKGPDGFNEDGVLNYPVDYKPGSKYPLVLVIHGGPEGASTEAFSALPQLIAAEGFFVFQPNYRGSTNLGDAYQHAIFRNTGEGPGQDVMAGLKKVEQLGVIDTNRIGISGWSYGGYMTSWLNGYYPSKCKAAVEGAALNDWVMDYTIAYYQTGDLYFFGGSPWSKEYWDIWRDQSPIVYAKFVKAPTLIMGDAGDPNVPIVNSYEMYHALKDNGVHTEFYTYPADTHFPHDIVRTTDVFKRWINWMVKYLK